MAYVENSPAGDGAAAAIATGSPGDFFALMKPRVMSLAIFTAVVGLVLAPGPVNPVLAAASVAAIAAGAGAAGALNMWYDADIDRLMARTAGRPVPSGRVAPEAALQFGGVLAVLAVLVLAVAANWLAAALLAFAIFFYAVVYTMWLKRSTPQNIVIGGAAGALPPLIGWVSVTGMPATEPLLLALVIFLWTPPHFWALALVKSDDYARAGVPMLPVVAGHRATRRQIVVYAALVAVAAPLPAVLGAASAAYGVFAGALGAVFVGLAVRLARTPIEDAAERRPAIRLFLFSILYLFLVFAGLFADAVVRRVVTGA